MTSELTIFAARGRGYIGVCAEYFSQPELTCHPDWARHADIEFNGLAVMLFTLQFKHNAAYRRICEARGVTPVDVQRWTQIPCVPTAAFKELDLTCLAESDRKFVFHSSGTTAQSPSRHFHNAESLALYEVSLGTWLRENCGFSQANYDLVSLTPPVAQAAHSSLVFMFDWMRREVGGAVDSFFGRVGADGSWSLDGAAVLARLGQADRPVFLVGPAFSFVHLLDGMRERGITQPLPRGSMVLETGGYKGRSRSLPKEELHELISAQLGVLPEHIICEYGMSELSSQAYRRSGSWELGTGESECAFHFPPWARVRVISPETGREVGEGETGLVQVFDLANVFSVLAIQTEDLAVRRGNGFELLGRATEAEPRGCSLQMMET
jgi:hypothetical protein